MNFPTLNYEKKLFSQGYNFIAGVDEAGRGAWAGPLVAATVIMPRGKIIEGVRDSKLISPENREILCEKIKETAVSWAVGIINIDFINKYNIGRANVKAFELAIENLDIKPDYVMIDGVLKLKMADGRHNGRDALQCVSTAGINCGGAIVEYESIKDGDAKIYSIAAASIIAKVTRDEILKKEHLKFPEYGFDKHKGYGTKFHQDALRKHGICEIHRVLYKPIKKLALFQ
ncbi:MAG: ribonuclease HII [bacterium]